MHMPSYLKEWGDVESMNCYIGTDKGTKHDQTFLNFFLSPNYYFKYQLLIKHFFYSCAFLFGVHCMNIQNTHMSANMHLMHAPSPKVVIACLIWLVHYLIRSTSEMEKRKKKIKETINSHLILIHQPNY